MASPLVEIRLIPPGPPPSRITPSRFHEPTLREPPKSNKVSGAPPASAIFLRRLPSIKQMNRLSGDQNGGSIAPISTSGRALAELSGCAQSCVLPSTVATKASVRPSGEIVGRSKRVAFSGGFTNKRTGPASDGGCRKYATPNASKASAKAPATIQARRSRQPLLFDHAEDPGVVAIPVRSAPDDL